MAVFLPYPSPSSLSGLFLVSFSSLFPLFLVRFRAYPGAERRQGDGKFDIKRMGRKEMEKWGLTDLWYICAYISIDNLHIQYWIYAFRQRSQCCNRNEIPRDVVTHFLMIPYTDPIFQVRNGNCPDDVHFRTSRHRQRLRQRPRPDVHHECSCLSSAHNFPNDIPNGYNKGNAPVLFPVSNDRFLASPPCQAVRPVPAHSVATKF